MKRITLLMIAFILLLDLSAQDNGPDSLSFTVQEAITFALANNLNAANARLDLESADRRVWETAARGLPQANASLNYNNNINLATTLIPDFFNDPSEKIEIQFGTKHFATAGLSASQLIFSGQYIVGLQTATLFKEFSKKNLELTEQQVKEAVVQTYYIVLLAEHTLESLKGNLENFRSIYNESSELYKAGFMEEIELDQLEVTLADIENASLSMERQLMSASTLLKFQMGIGLTDEIILTDNLTELVERLNIENLLQLEMSLESNINYQLLNDQEKLALMDMKLKQSEYLPTLSAFFSLDYTAQRDQFSFFDSNENWYKASAVGLSLNLPIFSSGMRMAGVSQKRLAYEKARNTKDYAAEGLKVEFMQARYDFASAKEKLGREERNLELSKKVVNVTEFKYSEGVASSLELKQVNDQYLQTLSSYTAAMVDLLNAKITLDILLNNI